MSPEIRPRFARRPARRLGQPHQVSEEPGTPRPPPRHRAEGPLPAGARPASRQDEALRAGPGGAGPAPLRRRREGRPGPDGRGRRKVRVRLRERRPQPSGRPLPPDPPRGRHGAADGGGEPDLEGTAAGPPRAHRGRAVGLRPLLPRRPRHRRVRPRPRHPPQPAGVGGLVLPGLAPRHLPRQPHGVRSLFRALPQPRPARPARHRHRLRLPAPRRDPEVRPRALRRGQDRRGLRLLLQGFRRPLGPLRDAPRVRRAARGGAEPRRSACRISRSRRASAWPPRPRAGSTSGSSPPSSRTSTTRSRSTSAGSS